MNTAIIDGHNYMHKFEHVVNQEYTLTRSWATSVVAVLLRELKLNSAVAVFDPLDKEPKPGRLPTPPRIVRDQPEIVELSRALGIIPVEADVDCFEGDQIICDVVEGIYHQHRGSEQLNLYIASSDKDMAQLVGPHRSGKGYVYMARPDGSGGVKILDETGVLNHYGVRPCQIADYLTLAGDATDGLSGTKGIGKKTATNLLQRWGCLENLLLTSSGLSFDAFNDKLNQSEVVLNPVEGLTKRLAENLADDVNSLNLFNRHATVELTPSSKYYDLSPIVMDQKKAVKMLGGAGLGDMAAKVLEGRLWN